MTLNVLEGSIKSFQIWLPLSRPALHWCHPAVVAPSPGCRVLSPGPQGCGCSLCSHFISQGLSFLGQKTKPWDCRLSEPLLGFPGGSAVKNRPARAGDVSSILGLGSSPGGRNGNPLKYCCLENPMDRGAWWATVHGVRKTWGWTEQKDLARTHTQYAVKDYVSETFHFQKTAHIKNKAANQLFQGFLCNRRAEGLFSTLQDISCGCLEGSPHHPEPRAVLSPWPLLVLHDPICVAAWATRTLGATGRLEWRGPRSPK